MFFAALRVQNGSPCNVTVVGDSYFSILHVEVPYFAKCIHSKLDSSSIPLLVTCSGKSSLILDRLDNRWVSGSFGSVAAWKITRGVQPLGSTLEVSSALCYEIFFYFKRRRVKQGFSSFFVFLILYRGQNTFILGFFLS